MRRYIDANLISFEHRDRLGLGIDYGTTDRSTYEIAYKSQIDKIPTADVEEVRHGEWRLIEEDVDGNGNNQYRCSLCEAGELHAPRVIVPYCWKCGAKMDKEKEE